MTRQAIYGGPQHHRTVGGLLRGGTMAAISIENPDKVWTEAQKLEAHRIATEVTDPLERERLLYNLRRS